MSPASDGRSESVSVSPLQPGTAPANILVIRLHALGDVALVLPAAAALRQCYPSARIEFLTSEDAAGLPRAFNIFDEILLLPRSSGRAQRLRTALRFARILRGRRYELILDLQRNWVSRLLRRTSGSPSWGEFDRFSPRPAADRTVQTFVLTGVPLPSPVPPIAPLPPVRDEARRTLARKGWEGNHPLIVLNPAGLWHTRNWPLENYVQFCVHWLEREKVTFLLVGTDRIAEKARVLAHTLDRAIINCAGETTLEEAIGLLSWADLVLTEDSGLMHISWALGLPIVALFGASNHLWSAPTGGKQLCLHSGDLSCGACMEPSCRFGDVHCLTRYAPGMVYDHARRLMSRSPEQ